MSINWFIALFLMLFSATSKAHDNHLIDRGKDVEIVYMFSYACPTCRLMSPYINAWSRVFPDLVPLPVFTSEGKADAWRNAARRRFVLHALSQEGVVKLSPTELDNIGYSILDEKEHLNVEDKSSVLKFLNGWAINPSDDSMNGAWQLSDMYMQDAESMIERIQSERGKVSTPVFRVSSSFGVEYLVINPDHEDPPMDFLQRVSDAVKKHKNKIKVD